MIQIPTFANAECYKTCPISTSKITTGLMCSGMYIPLYFLASSICIDTPKLVFKYNICWAHTPHITRFVFSSPTTHAVHEASSELYIELILPLPHKNFTIFICPFSIRLSYSYKFLPVSTCSLFPGCYH